jgi:hypothetical protein
MDSSQSLIRQEYSTEQKRWAITLLFTGCMTFFLRSFIDPLFGSLLVILGLLNLLINGCGVFLINGLVLVVLSVITLTGSIESAMAANSVTIHAAMGMVLGLLEGVWGVHELHKFIRYQRQINQIRSSQS